MQSVHGTHFAELPPATFDAADVTVATDGTAGRGSLYLHASRGQLVHHQLKYAMHGNAGPELPLHPFIINIIAGLALSKQQLITVNDLEMTH
jgi:hypothetical protein